MSVPEKLSAEAIEALGKKELLEKLHEIAPLAFLQECKLAGGHFILLLHVLFQQRMQRVSRGFLKMKSSHRSKHASQCQCFRNYFLLISLSMPLKNVFWPSW
jgi:hypothetical protein